MARQPYPGDLTDPQWRRVAPLIPPVKPGGRDRECDMRAVTNAPLYVNRGGCSWRAPPHGLPHRKTRYNFFRAVIADGTRGGPVTALRVAAREKPGRGPTPSGGRIDSQSVETASGGAAVGTDGAESVRGRKRHTATDTLGLLLAVVVTAANADGGTTAPRVPAELRAGEFPRLSVVRADSKCRDCGLDAWPAGRDRLRVEVPSRPDGAAGFAPVEKRWVVGQASGCLMRSRRPARDYGRLPETSAAMVQMSATHRMARRVHPGRGRRKFRYKRKPAT